MSIQRAYAQRNNNVSQLVPVFNNYLEELGPPVDLSGAAAYTLNLPTVEFVRGVYYVDLSGNDSSGNPLDVTGVLKGIDTGGPIPLINIINFAVNVPVSAAVYPGLEFTIAFKNIPYDRLTESPLLIIGVVALSSTGTSPSTPPIPYIVSPPVPAAIASNINQSITMKSDGTNWNVCSSGPAGWMGLPALVAVLAVYQSYIPPL